GHALGSLWCAAPPPRLPWGLSCRGGRTKVEGICGRIKCKPRTLQAAVQTENTGQLGHVLVAGVGHKGGDVELQILALLGEQGEGQAMEGTPVRARRGRE